VCESGVEGGENMVTLLVELVQAGLQHVQGGHVTVSLDPQVDLELGRVRDGVAAEDHVRVFHEQIAQAVGQRVVLGVNGECTREFINGALVYYF